MTDWLLDTNVVSELRRPKPDANVLRFLSSQPLDRMHLSDVSIAELRFGIEKTEDAAKRDDLKKWLESKVRPLFDRRVVPISEDVMVRWRHLVDRGRKAGHTFSQPDLIIAATALHHGMTLVTRDVKDYEMTRVPLCNPWLADGVTPPQPR